MLNLPREETNEPKGSIDAACRRIYSMAENRTRPIEIDYLTSMTSSRLIALLKKQFARFGVPNVIMSDGGPQFVSQQFQDFAKKWSINKPMAKLSQL